MMRSGIVRLVTMHIDHQAPVRSNPAECFNRTASIVIGALKMRNSAHDVDTEIKRLGEQGWGIGIFEVTILGEGDELQIQPRADLFSYLEQCMDCGQRGVPDIDMRAYCKVCLLYTSPSPRDRG